MSYEITAGDIHTEVNLRQCYNILGMDNLVRLTMKTDPLPREGRTNQIKSALYLLLFKDTK